MFDDDAMPGGGGLSVPPGLFKALVGLFQPKDRRAALQEALLELELRDRLGQGAVAYRQAGLEELCSERADWVILGPRGSGKTALAVSVAQAQAQALGWAVRGVGWQRPCAGVEPISWRDAQLRDRVVLVLDEHRCLELKPDQLWKAFALARHRERAFVLTAQSTTAIPPDVWRLGVLAAWKGTDGIGAAFEREELAKLVREAGVVLAAGEAPRAAAVSNGRGWVLLDCGLPNGWTDKDSLLWRA